MELATLDLSGSRMPAEWEPHAGTWLAWPHRRADWPGRFGAIPWVYAEIVRTLARYEDVHLLVADAGQGVQARRVLADAGADANHIHFHECPTDRSWMRDAGPIFVTDPDGRRAVLDWHFNAWAKYPEWAYDDRVPEFVAGLRGLPNYRPTVRGRRVVLEGGSIDVNGQGLMLTTEECLLSPVQERNPGLERVDYERVFAEFLGVRKVLWLDRGIAGDDTHGHVDDLARFVGPGTVVTVIEENESDDNHVPLRENRERLRSMTDLDGKSLEVVELPMPAPRMVRGQRIPASYANFYIANGVVIVPTFNDLADRTVLGILAELMPDRDVVGISCVDLVWGLGTLHCMTQQEPK